MIEESFLWGSIWESLQVQSVTKSVPKAPRPSMIFHSPRAQNARADTDCPMSAALLDPDLAQLELEGGAFLWPLCCCLQNALDDRHTS